MPSGIAILIAAFAASTPGVEAAKRGDGDIRLLTSPGYAPLRTDNLKRHLWPGHRLAVGTRAGFEGLNGFAKCVVREAPADVAAHLGARLAESQVRDAGAALAADNFRTCRTRSLLTFGYPYFRGALIEALYRRDFPSFGTGAASANLIGAEAGLKLAECVAAADPQESDRLVRTPIASGYQHRSFKKLQPAIAGCSRLAMAAPVNVQMLRYQIAEALYRRSGGSQEAAK